MVADWTNGVFVDTHFKCGQMVELEHKTLHARKCRPNVGCSSTFTFQRAVRDRINLPNPSSFFFLSSFHSRHHRLGHHWITRITWFKHLQSEMSPLDRADKNELLPCLTIIIQVKMCWNIIHTGGKLHSTTESPLTDSHAASFGRLPHLRRVWGARAIPEWILIWSDLRNLSVQLAAG